MEYLNVGRIVNTHGVKGEVKVLPLTDDPGRFDSLKAVYLDKKDGLQKLNIQGVKYIKSFVILKFKEVNDMNGAELLKEHYLKIDRKDAVKLPADSFFICDLIGSSVYDTGGTLLGEMTDVLKTGSNDVYVVTRKGKKDILVPALKSVVKLISPEDRRIVVELPEGLVDDEI